MKVSEKALIPTMEVAQDTREPEECAPTVWSDVMMLTKARLSALVLVTTLVGFLLASRHGLDWILLFHVMMGTGLVAAASSVFNQIMERDCDRMMNRTRIRPLPTGRMSVVSALWIGISLAVIGVAELFLAVNALSALLAAGTLFVYVLVYTPMKRASTMCTLVGAVSGAIPPAIGWAAARNDLAAPAWMLFGVLFFWQLPHFLAINWMYRDEYRRAGFVMWSNEDDSGAGTAWRSIWFSLGLLAVSLTPWVGGIVAPWYFLGAALLGGLMIWLSMRFLSLRTVPSARALFFYTLAYLPALLGLMLVASV